MPRLQEFCALSHQILQRATLGDLRLDFMRKVAQVIREYSACDAVELHLIERRKYYRCRLSTDGVAPESVFDIEPLDKFDAPPPESPAAADADRQWLRREMLRGHFQPGKPPFTAAGSFWTNDTAAPVVLSLSHEAGSRSLNLGGEYRSLAVFPLLANNHERIGLLELDSRPPGFFSAEDIEFYESLAQMLGVATAHRRAQVEVRERVKELTCLYRIAQVAERTGEPLNQILQAVVALLPPAWLYPEIAMARIIIDEQTYATPGFRDTPLKQSAEIYVHGVRRGAVEVVYAEPRSELDEGPFLKEERDLIEAVAGELEVIIERGQAAQERAKLEEQLRHADRLATIGQLSAGVAHELNEPLGNILGFAQLAQKCPGLPAQADQDLQKIVNASLHAREIIRKLMIFARQMPQQKTSINLNQVVGNGLSFLEARLAKGRITVVQRLAPNLPEVVADPSQVAQVLINLVVNAMQAMPEGGVLTVETQAAAHAVRLIVEDTGIGMSEEVLQQVFVPFFTTKEVGQGTGLGLSVVHGIVTAHGGTIKVASQAGQGSRFEVELPAPKPPEHKTS